MKSRLLGLVWCTALLAAAAEVRAEAHVLAKKDHTPPPGSKVTVESVSELKNGRHASSPGAVSSLKRTETVVTEYLSTARYRRTQTKIAGEAETLVDGKAVNKPMAQQGLLTGIPVIFEKKAGSYAATLDGAAPEGARLKALNTLIKKASAPDDLTMFGEIARKPGDKWSVNVAKLGSFGDAMDPEGSMSIEFIGTKEIDGVRCAVLKSTFELSGAMPEEEATPGKVALKGEETLHRALDSLVNLRSESSVQMTVTLDSGGRVEGPMTVVTRATLSTAGKPADGHILAKKNPPALVGAKVSREELSEMKGGKVSYSKDGQRMDGTMGSKGVLLASTEYLSPTRFRHLESKGEITRHSVINGNESKEPDPQSPIIGFPVILEIKDGRCTATLEKGTPSEEQEAELARLERKHSPANDLAMFGEVPRKPGDKWEVEVAKLYYDYMETAAGTMTVEFVEEKEIEGVRCAVLKSVFDLRGTAMDGGTEFAVLLKGQEILHRSLADLITLETKLTGNIVLMADLDGTRMELSSPLTDTKRAKLVKPKR